MCLMTARSGGTIETSVVGVRVAEIRAAFPDVVIEWRERRCSGLFRRIAIAEIERDFTRYDTNLILLGHHLTLLAEGVLLCAELGADRLITGSSGYQANEYMEQSDTALDIFTRLCAEFSVNLEAPVRKYDSLDAVKYQLLDFGVTTKSLEAVSLFADSFSTPTEANVAAYLAEKQQLARDYIRLRSQRFVGDRSRRNIEAAD